MSEISDRTERTLATLKDFQLDTVEHAFNRLWLADDAVKKFLVADEVGLGKTLVAKGLIARTVEHLWEADKRIDIVYICSNSQIARQNLSRLNVVGGAEVKHADRLTLLPKVIRNLRDQRINFVSFTPGTSFHVGHSGGAAPERVLLYWMFAEIWGEEITGRSRWKKFFQGGKSRENFERELGWFDRTSIDAELCGSFADAISETTGPDGGTLEDELDDCAAEFTYLRGKPSSDLSWRRNRLVGVLRNLLAKAAVQHLEPDLVILDEFQRFKDLLDADDDGARLAKAIFDHPDAKVLLLSATPYKMYTLPDEPEGDDHYRDFTRTVRFLAGDEHAHVVERELRAMRETLLSGGDHARAREARARVELELRRVMSRTERLASTPDRDGMLVERPLPGAKLDAEDLRSWRTFDDVARQIDRHDVFEYWRSTPYPLNLMDRNSYQVRTKFQAAAERHDPALLATLRDGRGMLNWEDVRRYQQVDPGNAKLRGLSHDVLDRGAWKLAWLPPSLPYYETAGAYAEPQLKDFTKRLIFSAWAVVPKAVAVMLSYDAERRAVQAAGHTDHRYDDRPITPPLQFRMNGDRPAGMPALALIYPCLVLARLGDPIEVARSSGASLPLTRTALFDAVGERVREALTRLPEGSPRVGTPDQRWYWAAPFLMDRRIAAGENAPFLSRMRSWDGHDEQDQESRLGTHLRAADGVKELNLGPRPDDLAEVLTTMAIAGPGVCALRALSRVTGGSDALVNPDIRDSAYRVAQGLRSLFNKPEVVALIRAGDDESYWRAVLDHAADGCLQAVLDEYVHVLIESEGLQDADPIQRAETITETMTEALSTRAATNTVEQVEVTGAEIRLTERRMSSHFAARYGRAQSDDKAAMRESTIRAAYNSPFRPFVLASTSVGQEGLDFHTYSHAIVHWNLPGNPVDLEQREGRVHRYKGHAVRKNVAADHGQAVLHGDETDPWEAIFRSAQASDGDGSNIKPFWIYTRTGGAVIERYVPALPLSREAQQYRRLLRTVGAYRLVIGQPRQDDLVRYVGQDVDWLRIDLTPPRSQSSWHDSNLPNDRSLQTCRGGSVAYAPALGETGMKAYRRRLSEVEANLGPRPSEDDRWTSGHSHEWFTLDWNAQRLAVLDHDIDAIIRTHAKDRRVAAWLEDTAEAFEEIDEIDLAIDWAKQATDVDRGHQSHKAADYWCRLLEQHRPAEALDARLVVFRRWPSSTSAARLHKAAGKAWPEYRDEIVSTLAASPRDAVLFALLTLKEPELAWNLAHSLALDSDHTWSELVKVYEKVDPIATLPIHQRLVENELVEAGAQHYRLAARRLAKMRKLAAGSAISGDVDELIADLRETHRRRPRLQQEFDRAGLP